MSKSRTAHAQKTQNSVSEQEYFNFIKSLNAEHTKDLYAYCLKQFLNYYKLKDLHSFLINPEKEKLIIQYLVDKKISRQYKNVILATITHACNMNDVVLNWKKIKKFISYTKTGNEIAGKDRGYTHEEIQTILGFSDQRLKTAYLILASTGMRIGALISLKVGDLERIQDLYKVTVYSGDKEQYTTFTTPEAAKEIDAYLEYRKRRGERITQDSHVIVKKFSHGGKSEPFKGYGLRSILQDNILYNTGLRHIGSKSKRKQIPVLHGFRKFFTKQLHDSEPKVDKAIIEFLLGHKIGLTSAYYKPTEQEMLNEYMKAIPLLTISNEERLRFKLEERIQIERTQLETLRADFDKFKKDVMKQRSRN